MVASSPIPRCRKPPAFACWYWRPASSSKRRMSAIVSSSSRQVDSSGSGSAAVPLPSLAARGLAVLVRSSATAAHDNSAPGRPTRLGETSRRASRLVQPVVAPEHLVADHDARNAANPEVPGALGRLAKRLLHGGPLDGAEHGARMDLGGRSREQHVVAIGEVPAGSEGLAKGGERERDRSTDLLGVGGSAHREQGVGWEGLGPANGQPVGGAAALHLANPFRARGTIRP